MKNILLVTFLLFSSITFTQIKLSGVVKDSIGQPLEMANVIAMDTIAKTIASYGFTDGKGNYKLSLSKNTSYNIKISYIGFASVDEFITSKNSDIIKNYTMYEDNVLDGIEIVSKMPVTVKGDTIVYNADSFKNGTERKLEDVLKKLPGVEINDDGEIEVEGKTVEKVMVNGKDFFDGDSKLASKNIPSNAVDKIQVLRNFSDVSQLSSVQDNQDRIALNIKLKKGKDNFWFGDITAGGGSSPDDALYLFQPKLFYYTPKYTLNFIGDLNNLGEVVLNRNDMRNFSGGIRSQSPSNGTNINLASAGIGFLTANARNANRIETRLGALNFSYSPNKKLDLSGFFIFSSNSNGQKNIQNLDYVDDTIDDDITTTTTDQTSNTGLVKLSAIYKKDINNQLNYDIIGRYSDESRTDNINSLQLSDISENENTTPYKINQSLSYFYTANEKNILALEVQHQIQDEDPFYVAALENDPTNNNTADDDGFDEPAETLGLDLDQDFYTLEQDRRVRSNQLNAKLDYYYIINQKSNLNFVGGTILSKQNFNSEFFQILDNGSEFIPSPTIEDINDVEITNNTEYNFTDFYIGLRYRLKAGIFTFTPGFTTHAYSNKNTQYDTDFFEDTFQKLLPEFSVIAQFKKSESLRFNYKQEVNFTDVNQIAKGIVANSYNSFFFGNADLINATSHRLNLNYSSFNLFNYSNVFARISYAKTIDQVNRNTIFEDGSVVSNATTINSPFNNESFTAFGRAGKTFNKIRTSLGGSFTYNKTYQFVNSLENINTIYSHGYNARIGTNFTKYPNLTLRYAVNFSDQRNTARVTDFNTVTHIPSVNFDAYIWNSLTFKTDFTFNEVRQNGTVQNNFNIWNATFSYRKDKEAKWEYEIEGSNLLGTNSRTTVSNGDVVSTINERFILPRLISFRLRYQL